MDMDPIARSLFAYVDNPRPFPGSEYPYTINQALFGEWHLATLHQKAETIGGDDLESQLFTIMALAEAAEASRPDREERFLGDREMRARLLRVNTTTGWALLWGDDGGKTAELARLLHQEEFQLYTLLPEGSTLDLKPARSLGSRPTSAIYFYQALLRYPLIYGRVPPGDTHEIGDFIQDHGVAVMFLARDLSPLEEALFLGGLALGIPAVVPPSFAYPYGTVLRADAPAAMVEAALSLPNLRLRRHVRFQVSLPFSFDFSFSSETVEGGRSLGGTPLSSFVVTNADEGEGIEIVGDPGADVGIAIAIGDRRVDLTMTDYLEEFAAKLPAYIEGVAAEVQDGCPTIRWKSDLPLELEQIGQAYYAGLKAHFGVDPIKVRLVFDPDRLQKMKADASAFRERRREAVESAREESEPYIYYCVRCHSFALDHACFVTPERPPQCGVRSWTHVKTRAILSPVDSYGLEPWQGAGPLHGVVEKGECLDPARGEYTGVNEAADRLTDGRTRRVFLHNVFGYPHTACSCFQGVSFAMPEVDGIGLIDVSFRGRTPDGRGWDEIANAAAGKQTSGFAAFGRDYLRSPGFLKGDGGWDRVVWMPRALKAKYAPDKDWIATEAEVSSVEELKQFLSAKGR